MVLRAAIHRSQRDSLLVSLFLPLQGWAKGRPFQISHGALKFVFWQLRPKLLGIQVLPGLFVGEVLCQIKYIRSIYCWAKWHSFMYSCISLFRAITVGVFRTDLG